MSAPWEKAGGVYFFKITIFIVNSAQFYIVLIFNYPKKNTNTTKMNTIPFFGCIQHKHGRTVHRSEAIYKQINKTQKNEKGENVKKIQYLEF